ncbi:Golgi integral membrane protein 4a [Solea solea]|uniref:Golgi integral membrane protein 4a n=1 Tax=Solea solea TaxID=90069 RepID=UPI00272A1337|nr:Golgi integral membrane protein 4a [Solea solea]
MGNGVCSRRQRRIFQCLMLLTVVCGMMYGGLMSYEMHKQLRRTEAMALKYQQHQESLSAQLQVVYEHRSRLEKSLQKERLEHKKAKEDYLVYKLEAQQSLTKEKQESGSRLNSLQVQHQMLKNQHDDLKKQYYELQDQHHAEGEDHGRLLDEHKDRYIKLQQMKEVEVSQLKENVYNLREENKHLRKAHHDIHVQLQDVQIQHQDLKATHDQLALTIQDHKSALAAAQVQVDEYKRLKDSLNRTPIQNPAVVPKPHVHEDQIAIVEQPHKEQPAYVDHRDTINHPVVVVHPQSEIKSHPTESHHTMSQKEEDDGEGEAERKRELAEEEMAQAGQPQKLEEDPDQPQDEEEGGEEPEQEQPDENELDRQRRQPQPDPHSELHQDTQLQHEANAQLERVKSAYEQQQEQQRLESQRAEERKQIHMRQEALRAQREMVLKKREQKLKEEQEREQQHHKEADRREQQLREEHQRKKTEYENMDNDIVQGEEDGHTDDEEERDAHMLHEEEDKQETDHRVPSHQQNAVDGELDPEDDPNNQGEDEFEEAEDDPQQQKQQHTVAEDEEEVVEEEDEPAAPAQHIDTHPVHEQPAVEEELVMAGNPDQQEDTLDDQYQEEVEDEAQEDISDVQKRALEGEEEGEDPYNEDNIDQEEVKIQEDARNAGDHRKYTHNNEEENYEEEEEEVEEDAAAQGKGTNRRAEM